MSGVEELDSKVLVAARELVEENRQLRADKAELVEALRAIQEDGTWIGGDWVLSDAAIDKADETLNKHKESSDE